MGELMTQALTRGALLLFAAASLAGCETPKWVRLSENTSPGATAVALSDRAVAAARAPAASGDRAHPSPDRRVARPGARVV